MPRYPESGRTVQFEFAPFASDEVPLCAGAMPNPSWWVAVRSPSHAKKTAERRATLEEADWKSWGNESESARRCREQGRERARERETGTGTGTEAEAEAEAERERDRETEMEAGEHEKQEKERVQRRWRHFWGL